MKSKKSGPGHKILYTVVLVLSIATAAVFLIREQRIVDATRRGMKLMEAEIVEKENTNLDLQNDVDNLDSREYIEEVARNVLMMAAPGETIYVFKEPEKTGEK